jgi:hypothetical protein
MVWEAGGRLVGLRLGSHTGTGSIKKITFNFVAAVLQESTTGKSNIKRFSKVANNSYGSLLFF